MFTLRINHGSIFNSIHDEKNYFSKHQGSISSTFNIQLLRTQIPKAYKDTDDLTVFFTLLGSKSLKASRKTLVKSTHVDERENIFSLFKVLNNNWKTFRCRKLNQ